MRKIGFLLLYFALTLVAQADPVVRLRADRESAVYKVGETIEFKVIGTPYKNATYFVFDGTELIPTQQLEGDVIKVEAKKPGFITVYLNYEREDGKAVAASRGGAAVEPEKIVPGVKKPADFDSFWESEVAKLREYPLEVVRETPVPDEYLKKYPGYKAYDIEAKRGDIAITGFLFVPDNAAEKSVPALLSFNGASSVTAKFGEGANLALRGKLLVLNVNFHALPNIIVRDKVVEAQARKAVSGYQFADCGERDKYYMRLVFLRTVVAADYLAQRKEYDGVNLGSFGGSLGGCQSLVCAALVPEVKFCVSNATAMCDHFGPKAGHLAGWPSLLENHPESEAVAPYFDVVNFATRIKCPIQMSVGFIDSTVSPASTYAAYNTISGVEKTMKHSVTAGHGAAWDSNEKDVFDYGRDEIVKALTK